MLTLKRGVARLNLNAPPQTTPSTLAYRARPCAQRRRAQPQTVPTSFHPIRRALDNRARATVAGQSPRTAPTSGAGRPRRSRASLRPPKGKDSPQMPNASGRYHQESSGGPPRAFTVKAARAGGWYAVCVATMGRRGRRRKTARRRALTAREEAAQALLGGRCDRVAATARRLEQVQDW